MFKFREIFQLSILIVDVVDKYKVSMCLHANQTYLHAYRVANWQSSMSTQYQSVSISHSLFFSQT